MVGCASAPTGPSIAVMPGAGKSFEQFNADDAVYRQYAANQNSSAVHGILKTGMYLQHEELLMSKAHRKTGNSCETLTCPIGNLDV